MLGCLICSKVQKAIRLAAVPVPLFERAARWVLVASVMVGLFGSPFNARGQERSIVPWLGGTLDVKPGSPFGPFDSSTESNSAITLGGTVLFGSPAGTPKGFLLSWSRFSDDAFNDLRHIDVLGVLRWVRAGPVYVDLQAGLSRASWQFAGQKETAVDWLLGPVVGLNIPFSDRIALDLAGVTQFRWSPSGNDYLRLGARVGLAFASGN